MREGEEERIGDEGRRRGERREQGRGGEKRAKKRTAEERRGRHGTLED